MEVVLGTQRIFLLSPANVAGRRAKILLNREASFELARRLHAGDKVTLGEAFTFMSGLYFRGKLAYARAFAQPPPGLMGVYVITSNRGLLPAETPITAEELGSFSEAPIDARNKSYSEPLVRTGLALADAGPGCAIILLGSVASAKYTEHLLPIFGPNLLFPVEFVGRGDMSRGGLLLRSAATNQMLEHVPVAGTLLRGKRPPKLIPVKSGRRTQM
ncbi:MAG: hypothetical protein JOZ08_13675 [Verrucomicrobia bacterium]|nr:hypothetical protein [Verrucomicrobiota bacterium]MBV8279046.1 hypothetical protein [Verrucomicrobiota bacterium]